jgi:hypothetical protein
MPSAPQPFTTAQGKALHQDLVEQAMAVPIDNGNIECIALHTMADKLMCRGRTECKHCQRDCRL